TDTLDCTTDNRVVREESWTRSSIQEDELTIEFFSSELGSYPKDVWRWGASTTDFATPVNITEWQGATTDTVGSTSHPAASTMEDFYDTGGGPIRDSATRLTYIPNHAPGSNVPLRIVDKGVRDSRLNRGKPVEFVVWNLVSKVLAPCEILNPIRLDDASLLEKTWNPGDYVPSYRAQVADSSQSDVIAKGAWFGSKWGVEVRRDLIPRESGIGDGDPDNQANPRVDDLQLEPGRRYSMRITIKDGLTKSVSQSGIIPIFLRPDNP
ncbi:MAG TPA: hypothetical protein VFV24_01635, partial [Candidatus Eisenbacteria bacterium]|nr:hypothetical protein [Candidatus Eisenbacteria bacterium]